MDRPIVAVVMAGGTGTRLYPASRSHRPKQFLAFGGDRSLLERTVERATFADEVIVLTPPMFEEIVPEHAPEVEVLVEPEPKDTGPALVYAAHRLRDRFDDAVLVCLPSDHHIEGSDAFAGAMRTAARVADETHGLVTVGVEASRPATGYGYVEPGPVNDGYAPVETFHEKPTIETASRLINAGCYWNAGIFAWVPSALLAAARESSLAPLVEHLDEDDARRGFERTDAVSVDYAIMEHTDRAFVVPADFEWDDLGSWDAIGRIVDEPLSAGSELDASGNVLASDEKHITVIGADDLVVAAYDDRVLVVPRKNAQRVRTAVTELRENGLF